MIHKDCLIIGAGLSGLLLGQGLKEKNVDFLILEKSRGVGGRLATRRIDNQGFDHGAGFLKFDPTLINLTHEMNLHHSIKLSDEGMVFEGGMTTLPKALAQNLPIQKETRALKIEKNKDHWIVDTESGESFITKILVITAPIPQALELLKDSGIELSPKSNLTKVTYSKGVLALFVAKTQGFPENPGLGVHSILPMGMRSLHPEGFVLRMKEEWSENNFDQVNEELLKRLTLIFEAAFKEKPSITSAELKKWRYLQPLKSLKVPYEEAAPSLFLCGDGFLYPDVRGSIHSALELLPKLL